MWPVGPDWPRLAASRSRAVLGFKDRSYDEVLERTARTRETTVRNRVYPRHKSQMRAKQEKVTN